MRYVSPYRRRLGTATVVSMGVMIVLYSWTSRTARRSDNGATQGALNLSTKPRDSKMPAVSFDIDKLDKSTLNGNNCPFHRPVDALSGRPLWVAGYPASGFDLVAHLISAASGITAVDVYRDHGCDGVVQDGAAPTGACLTHWPLVKKDSPSSLAVKSGRMYHSEAIFVIRNPAQAIPSYHTRWWGATVNNVLGNHDQPELTKWKKWRNKRLAHHLSIWEQSIHEWHRGVPAAGISGIGLLLPYEQFTSTQQGPNVTKQLVQFLESSHHQVVDSALAPCLWRRVSDDEHHSPKVYNATYTIEQKELFLSTLKGMIKVYQSPNDNALKDILQGYRDDIAANLPMD